MSPFIYFKYKKQKDDELYHGTLTDTRAGMAIYGNYQIKITERGNIIRNK